MYTHLQVEARTGYGGGYNERGVVEYRRREPSSEDEYDEFGRKKRKRKSDSQKLDEKVSFLTHTSPSLIYCITITDK